MPNSAQGISKLKMVIICLWQKASFELYIWDSIREVPLPGLEMKLFIDKKRNILP